MPKNWLVMEVTTRGAFSRPIGRGRAASACDRAHN